jgi:hypothetical protein
LATLGFTLERVVLREIPSKILPRTRDKETGKFAKTRDADYLALLCCNDTHSSARLRLNAEGVEPAFGSLVRCGKPLCNRATSPTQQSMCWRFDTGDSKREG